MGRPSVVLSLLVVTGCSPLYAPPIRGLHAGMPGRLRGGQLEAGLTVGGLVVPTMGGPHVGYGVSDSVTAEGGVNLNTVNFWLAQWATGWAGIRFTHRLSLSRIRIIGDAELGAGAGAGGTSGNFSRWNELRAYGIYEGVGLGLQWRWLGIYLRARLDAAASSAAPTTLWPSAMLGVELRPGRRFSVGLGGGYGGYWNTSQFWSGWFYQAQVAFIFDLLEQQVP